MLKKYFFDKSFWKGSALQVRCSFQAVKLRYIPLQYSCQKVVCFWQCKLVNNQHSFQKSTNSYCSWKVFFAFKTSFPDVLAPLQKTKQTNNTKGFAGVLIESWFQQDIKYTRNIQKHAVPEILRLGFKEIKTKNNVPKSLEVCWKKSKRKRVPRSLAIGRGRGWPAESLRILFFVSKCFSYFDRCGWPEELSQNIAFLQCGFGSTHSWTNVVWMGFKLWFNVIHIYSLLMFFFACCTWKSDVWPF